MKDYHQLPSAPGVYLFKDNSDRVIYVGKAKNLKQRVRSYFASADHSPKTKHLISRIKDLDFIMVDSELEALLLENKLIKQYSPKYNISLKDSKTYAYILVTDEDFPRIAAARKTDRKGKYFGPYVDGSARHQLMQLAIKLFRLRICRTLPARACLNYHLNLCTAPCIGNVNAQQYNKQVQEALQFLSGNTKQITSRLTAEMKQASHHHRFEIALEKRRQLEAIAVLNEKQKVDLIRSYDQDIIALHSSSWITTIMLFSIKRGVIQGKKEFRLEQEPELLSSFITSYYQTHPIPEEIILSEPAWDEEPEKLALARYLSTIKGTKVTIVVPQRGSKGELVKMVRRNAAFGSQEKILEEMQQKLRLPAIPRTIECFDISNLSYEHIVAGMTRWIDGSPHPADFRRFEIVGVSQKNDDISSMREVIFRRYSRLNRELPALPDLIIIDGGPGQLNAAISALKTAGVVIPMISLAKRHEEIFIPYSREPLKFDINSAMMLFIRHVRDRTHRYALSYNIKKRQMKLRRQAQEPINNIKEHSALN